MTARWRGREEAVYLPCRRAKARMPPVLVPAIQSKSFTIGCLVTRSRFSSTCMRMRPRIPPPSVDIKELFIITKAGKPDCPSIHTGQAELLDHGGIEPATFALLL